MKRLFMLLAFGVAVKRLHMRKYAGLDGQRNICKNDVIHSCSAVGLVRDGLS